MLFQIQHVFMSKSLNHSFNQLIQLCAIFRDTIMPLGLFCCAFVFNYFISFYFIFGWEKIDTILQIETFTHIYHILK